MIAPKPYIMFELCFEVNPKVAILTVGYDVPYNYRFLQLTVRFWLFCRLVAKSKQTTVIAAIFRSLNVLTNGRFSRQDGSDNRPISELEKTVSYL